MRYTSLLLAGLALAARATAAPTAPASRDLDTDQSKVYAVGAAGFKHVIPANRKLNIVLTNDDSWASSNIRATYYALRTAGHHVQVVAPARAQSGKGGTVKLPDSLTLPEPGAYGALEEGAPYHGKNASDPGLSYFDGTPNTCVFWALDVVKPFSTTGGVDLVVSGPNEGQNLGPFLFTLSGTIGATYGAVGRGIPAIAFSANSDSRSYLDWSPTNSSDPSNMIGTATANFVTSYVDALSSYSSTILPQGVGLSVNYATIDGTCNREGTSPIWEHTRLTGSAYIDQLGIDADTGLPTYSELVLDDGHGLNTCLNGDCDLRGETAYLPEDSKCKASVSVFSVDYDAPTKKIKEVDPALEKAVGALNA